MTCQSRRSTMTYEHLIGEERYQIYALRRQGISTAVIALELNRSRSTITRELNRNTGTKGYKLAKAND